MAGGLRAQARPPAKRSEADGRGWRAFRLPKLIVKLKTITHSVVNSVCTTNDFLGQFFVFHFSGYDFL